MSPFDASGATAGLLAGALVLATAAAGRAALAAARAGTVARRVPARPDTLAGPVPQWFVDALADTDGGLDPTTAWRRLPWAVAAIALVGLAFGGPALAALLVGSAAVAARVWVRSRRGQASARLDRALPTALEAVARSLRSGAALGHALAEAADASLDPLGAELRRVTAEAAAGVSLAVALEGLAERQPSAAVRLAVAAMALGVDTGGAQARAIDGVAATLRDRLAVEADVRALSSQARASAVVIGVAPAVFGGLAAVSDRQTAAFLFRTPLGLACLAGGLGLDALSWMWMRRLMRVGP